MSGSVCFGYNITHVHVDNTHGMLKLTFLVSSKLESQPLDIHMDVELQSHNLNGKLFNLKRE